MDISELATTQQASNNEASSESGTSPLEQLAPSMQSEATVAPLATSTAEYTDADFIVSPVSWHIAIEAVLTDVRYRKR
jgi:hypothetical protein